MIHASIFELDSIQSYLFSSGRLRDVAGASEMIDQLTEGEGSLLDQVTDAVGGKEDGRKQQQKENNSVCLEYIHAPFSTQRIPRN